MQERDPIERTSKESDVATEFKEICSCILDSLIEHDKGYMEDFSDLGVIDARLRTAVGLNVVTITFSAIVEDDETFSFCIYCTDNDGLKNYIYIIDDGKLQQIELDKLGEDISMLKKNKNKNRIIRSRDDNNIIGVLSRIQEDLNNKEY